MANAPHPSPTPALGPPNVTAIGYNFGGTTPTTKISVSKVPYGLDWKYTILAQFNVNNPSDSSSIFVDANNNGVVIVEISGNGIFKGKGMSKTNSSGVSDVRIRLSKDFSKSLEWRSMPIDYNAGIVQYEFTVIAGH